MSIAQKYAYRVIWSEEDGEFVGLCAEFPSLSHLAKARGAALDGIVELVEAVVRDLRRAKEPVPEPIALTAYKGKIALRLPPEQHRALALEAAEQNVSLNRWIARKLG